MGRSSLPRVSGTVAGEEIRDTRDVVGENEAEKVLEECDHFVALRIYDRDVAKPHGRAAGLLEAWNRSFNRVEELNHQAARPIDLDQLGNAGLAVGLVRSGESSFADVTGKVGGCDVGFKLKAHVEQLLLGGRTQYEIVMVVADRQIDRTVVSLRDLGHPEILQIVLLRSFDVRRPERDISELEHFWIEFLALHGLLLFKP